MKKVEIERKEKHEDNLVDIRKRFMLLFLYKIFRNTLIYI